MCRLVTGHKAMALQEVSHELWKKIMHELVNNILFDILAVFVFKMCCFVLYIYIFLDLPDLPALSAVSQIIYKSRCSASYTAGESQRGCGE